MKMMTTLASNEKTWPFLGSSGVTLASFWATDLMRKEKEEMIRARCLVRLMTHLSDRVHLNACNISQHSFGRKFVALDGGDNLVLVRRWYVYTRPLAVESRAIFAVERVHRAFHPAID